MPQTKAALPHDIREDIKKFQIDGYAAKYFSTHRVGLFRRTVPLDKMLRWSKESLHAPLLTLHKSLHKIALKCNKRSFYY
jgi:hypothetical protein